LLDLAQILVVDGGFAAVSLALACVKNNVVMVSRLRWDAALYHPPGPQPPGKRGPKPLKGQRQRSLQGWAERSDTPWETGDVRWYGFMPNHRALRMANGALAGICLLHDHPNYRHSMPTKIVEYMAHGLPVVTTANPMAEGLVTGRPEGPAGRVVPFGDVRAAADAVLELCRDGELRRTLARTGHEITQRSYHWPVQARLFVKRLEEWVAESAPPVPAIPRQRSRPRSVVSE
jgi:hypothetical protein